MPRQPLEPRHALPLRAELRVDTTPSSFGRKPSNGRLRSRSQKKRASDRPARSTRSLPAIEAGAADRRPMMLATHAEVGARPEPSGVAQSRSSAGSRASVVRMTSAAGP
jgi:hypothetical protein